MCVTPDETAGAAPQMNIIIMIQKWRPQILKRKKMLVWSCFVAGLFLSAVILALVFVPSRHHHHGGTIVAPTNSPTNSPTAAPTPSPTTAAAAPASPARRRRASRSRPTRGTSTLRSKARALSSTVTRDDGRPFDGEAFDVVYHDDGS